MINPQDLVIENIDSNNMVNAGPGSGKTRTVIHSVKHLLEIKPYASPLLITFTNASASEMRTRLKKLLPKEALRKVKVSTFHALMLEIIPNFNNQQLVIGSLQLKYIYRALNILGHNMTMPDAYMAIEFYGRQTHPSRVKDDDENWIVYQTYCGLVEQDGMLDLNMITRIVIQGMSNGVIPLTTFSHIIFDEFQDSDPQQILFLKLHRVNGTKVTCVGDDWQSIYSFRGACGYKAMQEIMSYFNSDLHLLNDCYRCTPNILQAASKLINLNTRKMDKALISKKKPGKEPIFYSWESKDEEAEALVEIIKRMPDNWGILARNNSYLDTVEQIFIHENVSYQRLSGKVFWDNFEIAMQLHMINCLVDQNSTRSLTSALVYLNESEEFINHITVVAKQAVGILKISEGDLTGASVNTVKLFKLLHKWNSYKNDNTNLEQVVLSLFHLVHAAKSKPDKVSKDAYLAKSLCRIITGRKGSSLYEKLKWASSQLHNLKPSKEIDRNVCQLMTLHGSKGLEWPSVAIISCNSGVMPSSEDQLDIIEEERRLLFVGMTRAEENLVISSSNKVSSLLLEAFPEIYSKDSTYVRQEVIDEFI